VLQNIVGNVPVDKLFSAGASGATTPAIPPFQAKLNIEASFAIGA
jgi:hypothetical protein